MTYNKELEIFRFRKSQFGKKSSDQKDKSDDAKENYFSMIGVESIVIKLRPFHKNFQNSFKI